MSLKITTPQQARALLANYDYFLFDCDGVIWLGDHLLPSVAETLALLKKMGKAVIFVTNNLTKAREDYLRKFELLGIPGIQKSEVFGSSYALAVYVDKILRLPKDKKVWVLGESGIESELHEMGYQTLGGTDPALVENGVAFDPNHRLLTDLDPAVGCVVAGLTTNINYLKLSVTMQYLLKDGKLVPFVATNIDLTFPLKGKLLIGAGSIVETVSYASGRSPDAICGKPNQSMMQSILADRPGLKENPKRGLMVGDRLNTDMKFGRDGGLDTLLVLTGIETQDAVEKLDPAEAPTYFAEKLGDLFELTR
ncbi:2-phosphoglycolate phosphatase [Metschnikowia bicuspidata var. bicuspidata NRRL YB-4993]|uniref:4-nitrophenylphosphatase n=1 Tax=Metschnikowia bicuspidata var. bicuspidata NRRL YB-4993 TaxID=869754 RepID=A0A1A0HGS1_9ASCO|nr:2-phosphoglycolate phosphatase [Metschnikowia bicuspidata var. bicuspidata NRRL YB-4993]OBA23190.1 2-phosphoglycolate phosphatase [Metschnikowia bicuspidata var. bicuspidata NRRL YB-4993]